MFTSRGLPNFTGDSFAVRSGARLFSGGGGGETTTKQVSDPWSGQQPYISSVFQNAQKLYDGGQNTPTYDMTGYNKAMQDWQAAQSASGGNMDNQGGFRSMSQTGQQATGGGASAGPMPTLAQFLTSSGTSGGSSTWPQYYPDSTVQPFNPMQFGSLAGMYNTGMDTGTLDASNNALKAIESGTFLNAGNPYWQKQADQVTSQLTPQIEAGFTQGNSMNNPAAGFAVGNGLGTALGSIAGSNYNTALSQIPQAAYIAPSVQQGKLASQGTAFGAGQTQQQQSQSELADLVNRWNYNQQLPFQMLNQYANQVNGQYGGTSTMTQPYYNNGGANLLSGAMGGASLGSMLFPAAAGGTAWGGMGGAGLGALFALSDRRLKKNVIRLGKLMSGVPIYAFDYVWGGARQIGAMADEVQKILPHAVGNIFGYNTVNYRIVAGG